MLHTIFSTFSRFGVSSAVDIIIVGLIFYGLLMVVRGTRADQILRGLIVVFIVLAVATSIFHLTMVEWLLRNSPFVLLVGVPIIFAPELRRALEQVGRSSARLNHPWSAFATQPLRTTAIDEVVSAASRLSDQRYGALITLEGVTGLQEYVRSGVRIDGEVTADLMVSIFLPSTPLHDGAVIIRGDRVIAAGCVLPLSDNVRDSALGTRHRAAIGITELTDATCIAVSEETGAISIARGGQLSHVSPERLHTYLTAFYRRHAPEPAVAVGT